MDGLIGWATDKGVKLHKLTPQHRHFVVAEDVQAGDTLVAVPQQLLLYGELALDDAEYAHAFRQLAAELGSGRDARHLLCVLLVLEKAREAQSSWAPYISILPEEYDDPYWWADDQIALVKGTPLSRAIATHYQGLHQITASVQRLEQLYNSSKPPGSSASVLRTYRNGWALKLAAARWARSAVWSRSFTIRMLANGVRNIVAMVPVLDMIDHSPHMEVIWHTGRDGTEPFQFTPLGHTSKGTIMTNNYGRKPSDELLLAYGFLLDHPNPADHFVVSLSHRRAPTNSAQQQQQQLQLQAMDDQIVRVGHTSHTTPFSDRASHAIDVGDDDLAAQQQAAEDVQRSLLLCSLRLSADQKLSLAEPLPSTLLLGAQICILPFPQLYLWTAHVQNVQRAIPTMALQASQQQAGFSPEGKQKRKDGYHSMPVDGKSMQQDGIGIESMDWQEDSNSSILNGVVGRKRPWQGSNDGRESSRHKSTADGLTALLHADSAMHIGSQTGDGTGWAARSNGFQHSITTPVHFLYRLQSLVSINQQLQSRIDGMASDHQIQLARQHGAVHLNGLPSRKHAGSPHHSKLALAYVDTQKNLVRQSMAAVSQHISQQVHAAAALVQRCIQQRLITCKPLQTTRTHTPTPPLSSLSNHTPTVSNTWQALHSSVPNSNHSLPNCWWSSIDPDLHLQQYNKWLKAWGLQPNTAQAAAHVSPDTAQIVSHALADGMDGVVSNHEPATKSFGAGVNSFSNVMYGSQLGSCSMQEVVFVRTAPPQLIARRASRETLVQPDPPPSSSRHNSSAQAQQKAVNGRARGPPSSSRTFTMKGAKPSALPTSTTHTCGEATAASNSNSHPATSSNVTATAPHHLLLPPNNNSPLKRVTLPQGLCASLGIDSDHDPVALGVKVSHQTQAGDVLLQVPLQCCLRASSQQQLINLLMSTANNLLLQLAAAVKPVLGPYGAPNMGTGAAMASIKVPLSRPADMLVWHLLHSVAAAPSVRLYASDVEGVQLLVEMLEDSPAAGSYQEVFDTMKTEFTHVKNSAVCKQLAETDNKEAAFIRLLRTPSAFHLYLWSKQVVETCALRVNCPATTQGHLSGNSTEAAAQLRDDSMVVDGQPQPNSPAADDNSQWILAPVIASVCNELHQALFAPEIAPSQPTTAANVQNANADGLEGTTGHVLIVRAACELQPDLHLTPLLLLPGLDIEELMTSFGPEALPWHQLLHMSAAAFAARFSPVSSGGGSSSTDWHATANHSRNGSTSHGIELLGGHTRIPTSNPAANTWQTHLQLHSSNGGAPVVPTSAESSQLPHTSEIGTLPVSPSHQASMEHRMTDMLKSHVAGVLQSRTVLYELYICPGEQDPLSQAKLTLLAAIGLGCVHYLSVDLATEQFVLCALKICLAGKELLQHSLAQQCVALHARAQNAVHGSSLKQQQAEQVQPSSACGSTGLQSQAEVNQNAGSTPVSAEAAFGELHAARSQLLDMLTHLSDDLPVCKAARKQLRQMVHDARKNTRRRLKQLEAVHNVIANHVSGSSNPFRVASAANLSSFGGSYHPLGGSSAMHEGVRLYLACVCDLLDTWADHLGLNRQSDSMSKRHKSRSEENA